MEEFTVTLVLVVETIATQVEMVETPCTLLHFLEIRNGDFTSKIRGGGGGGGGGGHGGDGGGGGHGSVKRCSSYFLQKQ